MFIIFHFQYDGAKRIIIFNKIGLCYLLYIFTLSLNPLNDSTLIRPKLDIITRVNSMIYSQKVSKNIELKMIRFADALV